MAIYGEVNLQMIPVDAACSSENEYNNFLYIDKSVNKDLLKKLKDKEILEKINLND